VIIPARNEAANIGPCVESVLRSGYPTLEVLVVDDRSSDGTAGIVRTIANRDSRLRLVEGADLPGGLYGKPWACWQGYEASGGRLLCFTDADTRHGPRLLELAVAALERERADLLTVMPLQEMKSFWERAVQPFFFLLLGLRFGSPARLNRNTNPRNAIANGQFILVTRDSYEWTGGHRKVAGSVIEDVMLARLYTMNGRRLLFAMAEHDMTTRMYRSLREIVAGWGKNVFAGIVASTGSVALARLAGLGLLIVPALFVLPPLVAAAGVYLRVPALAAFGAAHYLANLLLIGGLLRLSRAPFLMGIFNPLGALAQGWIILRAVARGSTRIEWKGRRYSSTGGIA
jgi:chlorobactene glucosyltransferase